MVPMHTSISSWFMVTIKWDIYIVDGMKRLQILVQTSDFLWDKTLDYWLIWLFLVIIIINARFFIFKFLNRERSLSFLKVVIFSWFLIHHAILLHTFEPLWSHSRAMTRSYRRSTLPTRLHSFIKKFCSERIQNRT